MEYRILSTIYYVFFQFLLLTIFNLQANILTTKDILSNLGGYPLGVLPVRMLPLMGYSFEIDFQTILFVSVRPPSVCDLPD